MYNVNICLRYGHTVWQMAGTAIVFFFYHSNWCLNNVILLGRPELCMWHIGKTWRCDVQARYRQRAGHTVHGAGETQ